MSRWTPCKRSEFIRRLLKLGFDGPYSGTRISLWSITNIDWLSRRTESFQYHNSA